MAEAKKKFTRPTSLASLMKTLSDLGAKRIDPPKIKFNPTGILSLDLVLHGGLPISRMVLWYGAKGTGKSTTMMILAREQMRRGNRVLWIDSEHSFDVDYATLLGMDNFELLDLVTIGTLEAAWDLIINALSAKAYSLIVIDTLAKLPPSAELAASASANHMALGARQNSQSTRMWGSLLADSPTTVVFLNQERSDLGSYGAPNINPGGKALEHESALTLYMKASKNVYKNGRPETLNFRFSIRKSKVFPSPGAAEEFEIHIACSGDVYEIDYPYELYYVAKSFGLFEDKNGDRWSSRVAFYQGERIEDGEANILKWFAQPSELRDKIEAEIIRRIEGGEHVTVTDVDRAVPGDEAGAAEPGAEEAPPDPDFPGDPED